MIRTIRNQYLVFAWIALLWAVGNTVYVYVFLGGERTFRIESATFVLIGVLLPLVCRRSSPDEHGTALTATDTRLLIAVAVALWLLTLVPFLKLPFLSDDYVFLASYRRWSDVQSVRSFVRPVFAVVFILLSRIANGSPLPFHLAALLIHGASAWCVYVLSRRLFKRVDAAALCLAMFLLNPLQLEAVLWVSGLQELLWSFFVLLGLVVYSGARALSFSRLIATVLLVALALLSKEAAISSILLLPASDWVFFRMRRGSGLVTAYIAFGLVAAGYLVARTQASVIEFTFFVAPGKYFAQKFLAMPYRFFVQPWNLAAVKIPALVSCAATLTAFAVVFWAVVRGTGPMSLVGPAVILISTLPVYSYFYVAPDLRASRYLYFAATGWAILATQLLTTLITRRLTMAAVFGSLVLMSYVSLRVNANPWWTAGEIVDSIAATIREGKSPETDAAGWQTRYGDGLEVKGGVPRVYKGVYLFVNGYAEFRTMLTDSPSNALDR